MSLPRSTDKRKQFQAETHKKERVVLSGNYQESRRLECRPKMKGNREIKLESLACNLESVLMKIKFIDE